MGRRRRNAPAAGSCGGWRSAGVAAADALHHAGDLHLPGQSREAHRPLAPRWPPAGRRRDHRLDLRNDQDLRAILPTAFTSSAVMSQLAAFTLASICSGFVAPAMTLER